ncbi:biliverdin-producing heme oxygenase [Flavobacterium profundi]|uniref:biliverdin-producing heme oxygenase n=1 Tax=Flavobacterium profundi TaxID=1774945 RepID=UPI0015E8130F|nr:biliverdin-producing heme oxygenase [Flavobacterium profundi]
MLVQLKEETKLFHSSVEKVLIAELKEIATKNAYGNLLLKLHNFYESIESKLQLEITEAIIPDIKSRNHVKHLKNDLYAIGHEIKDIENNFASKITNLSYALGVLYVIEGSTLGGKIITNLLKRQLNLTDLSEISYFNSYGEATDEMWHDFKQHITTSEEFIDKNEMILGAKDTFEALRIWLLQN